MRQRAAVDFIDCDYHRLVVDLKQMLKALPEMILSLAQSRMLHSCRVSREDIAAAQAFQRVSRGAS